MNEVIDMRISGSSTMPGGEYGNVTISGAGKIQGSVKCTRLSCSGAASVNGDVVAEEISCSGAVKVNGSAQCNGRLATSGRFQAEGSIQAGEVKCSGSIRITGNLSGDFIRISGSLEVRQNVSGKHVKSSGSCRIGEGVEAETVELAGRTEIAGLLNAETITILAEGSSEIGDIGCTTVTVSRRQQGQGLLAQLFSRAIGGLTVGTIEGDEIRLEHTKAKVVRGKQVVIGPGCEIDRVEYTESCQAEAGTVAESIKL